MFKFLKKLKNQAIYQGKKRMKRYFEGWYFKIVDPTEQYIFAIIPGVSFDKDGNGISFIQFFNGSEGKMTYIEYNIDKFKFSSDSFEIWIGDSYFSEDRISLSIDDEIRVDGEIEFSGTSPWPVSVLEPGVMGWYRYVPKMECYHGIVSFNHKLSGELQINNDNVDFNNGKGYIEKDYGRSFPEYYIWAQSNHFGEEKTSLMVSIAKIPWLFSYFDGFIAGFLLRGKLYKFTTYTKSKITELIYDEPNTRIVLEKKGLKLELFIARMDGGTSLPSPVDGSMTGRILESMNAEIEVKLVDTKNNELLFEGTGRNAGYDVGGKIENLRVIGSKSEK